MLRLKITQQYIKEQGPENVSVFTLADALGVRCEAAGSTLWLNGELFKLADARRYLLERWSKDGCS